MNKPENEKRLVAVGSEAVDPMPPEQLKKEVAAEFVEIETAIKELGIKF
jgi:hypothetical protein